MCYHRSPWGRVLYLENVLDRSEDEVVSSQRERHVLITYSLGRDAGLVYELRAAPDEGDELVVVEAPDSLAAGWLHPVTLLQLLCKSQVAAGGHWQVSLTAIAR